MADLPESSVDVLRSNIRGPVLRTTDPGGEGIVTAMEVNLVVADLTDPDTLPGALDGVDGVFHIGPAFAPREAEMGLNLVHAAQQAGVRRFAFSSIIHPVVAEETPLDQWVTATPPGPTRDGLARMFAHYHRYGLPGGNDLTLSAILGRPPRSLHEYIHELATDSAQPPIRA